MVDLDSDPTKLIDIVEIGKQLLITRGALTTFSIANDVAKYFAIIPAMFVAAYPVAGQAQRDGPGHTAVRDPLGGDLQRAGHRGADPVGAARCSLPRRLGDRRCCAATSSSSGSAASSCRSSASSSSTCSSRPSPESADIALLTDLSRQSLAGLRLLLVLTVLLGVGYPAAVWGAGQAFGDRADGSARPPRRRGRRLPAARPAVRGRRSGSTPVPRANDYDTLASAPSNLGPLRPRPVAAIRERERRGRRAARASTGPRCPPTPSPPPAPASTRTSPPRTPSSRSPASPPPTGSRSTQSSDLVERAHQGPRPRLPRRARRQRPRAQPRRGARRAGD